MFRLQTDIQELLWHGQLKCAWLGRRPPDPKWIDFVNGRPVEVSVGRLSSWMAMTDTPFVETVGLRIFRELSKSSGNAHAVEVFVFPRGTSYIVNLLRITDKNGRGDFRSLLQIRGRKQFRFANLCEALRMAMRVVSARIERDIARVLRRAENDMNTTQEG